MACVDENAAIALLEGRLAAHDSAALLAHAAECESCRQLVAELAKAATLGGPAAPRTTDRRRGDAVGRYVILGLLGEGGMGVVYLAYDPDLDRRVALKFLRGSGHRQHLLDEAQAVAKLSHPNVVSIFDVGASGDELYVAMEYIPGQTLREWLVEPRGWRQIVGRFTEAGRGLAAAHAAGIVHRDFKPDNVIVPDDGRIRVLDFGLAQREPGTAPHGGTPRYMAPEQIANTDVGPAADQFSFCVALYEALYGQHPFAAETAIGEPAMRPPPRDSRVPQRIAKVVARGLAVDPAARFGSLDSLFAALSPRRSSRTVAIAASAALVALGAGTFALASKTDDSCASAAAQLAGVWDGPRKVAIGTAFMATRASFASDTWSHVENALDGYTHEWTTMHRQACEATRSHQQSAELLDLRMQCLARRLQDVKALGDVFATADKQTVERAVQATGALTGVDSCNQVESLRAPVAAPREPMIHGQIDRLAKALAEIKALDQAGKYPEALQRAEVAARQAEALGYRPLQADILVRLGMIETEMGQARGEATLFEAIRAAEAGRHDHAAAQAWLQLVAIMTLKGRFDEGERWAALAGAIIERLGRDDKLSAGLEQRRGVLLWAQGKADEALPHLQAALASAQRNFGPDGDQAAGVLQMIGLVYAKQGKLEQALTTLEKVRTMQERGLGAGHPLVAGTMINTANVLSMLGRYDDALAMVRRSLDITEAALGHDSTDYANRVDNLGILLQQQGRTAEGIAEHERALAIREQVLGKQDPHVAHSLAELGDDLLDAQRYREALAAFQRAADIYSSLRDPDRTLYAVSLAGIGEAQLGLGAPQKAIAPLQSALAMAVDPKHRAKMQAALTRALRHQ